MNQKQKSKIALFFSGLNEKYNENSDYFLYVEFELTSGIKKYNGKITTKNDEYILSFVGKKTYNSFKETLSELIETILKYDKAIVSYHERGLCTEIVIDDKNIKLNKKESENKLQNSSLLKEKEYNISLHKAKYLLFELGFTSSDGKLKNDMIRKYNQTDRFVGLVGDMFEGMDNINIVDCACGKSYLSFVLNYWLWEEKRIKSHFTGLDISEQVINESRKIAKNLNYSNMKFIQTDLSLLDDDSLNQKTSPDAVISLHACDTATDMAIGYGIRNNAKNIICAPCCHKELLEDYHNNIIDPLVKHGIIRARFNDLLTDSLRMLKLEACGYKVSCVEFCSPIDTPKNLLIKAKKTAYSNKKAEDDYRDMLREFNVFPSIEIYSKKLDKF